VEGGYAIWLDGSFVLFFYYCIVGLIISCLHFG